jgi:hypothetical protein
MQIENCKRKDSAENNQRNNAIGKIPGELFLLETISNIACRIDLPHATSLVSIDHGPQLQFQRARRHNTPLRWSRSCRHRIYVATELNGFANQTFKIS